VRSFYLVWALLLAGGMASAEVYFVVVGGLGGDPRYEQRFSEEAGATAEAARAAAGDDSHVTLLRGPAATREAITEALTALQSKTTKEDAAALMLLGHGAFDGETFKFNIPGPDLSDKQLLDLLEKIPAERQLVVLAASSSGAALKMLQAENRIVITATKSGRERNAVQFGRYWAEALSSEEADVNKNNVISAQEAYTYAEAKVKAYYEAEKRLATEHARLEGELAGSFTLARLAEAVEAARDPELAPLYQRREDLERKIDQLKLRKESMSEDEYFDELQKLLVELSTLQEQIAAKSEGEESAEP